MCFINHVTLCLFINQTCTHRRLPTQFNRVLCPLLIVHFNFTPKAFRNFLSQPEGGLKLINVACTLWLVKFKLCQGDRPPTGFCLPPTYLCLESKLGLVQFENFKKNSNGGKSSPEPQTRITNQRRIVHREQVQRSVIPFQGKKLYQLRIF